MSGNKSEPQDMFQEQEYLSTSKKSFETPFTTSSE